MLDRVLLATANPKKAQEIIRLLSSSGIEVILPDRSLQVEEGGCSFLENAYLKARAYWERYGIPTLADDSGLVVPSLEGYPGVFSSRFYQIEWGGREEVTETEDEANIRKLLRLMEGKEDRRAYFVAYVVLYAGDWGVWTEGRCWGSITTERRGNRGFGYDPVFVPEGDHRTMAELSPEEKDSVSHRGKALRKLLHILKYFTYG
ncbi:non-canonical purine NTP pyrophosphatase, rdgB/HAM1 family [Thermocrinis albus DSM 14484]|uniref:dITP/XTP pyrophosphatase n=1 Tax=Thermocrinis albus (strain DSM 14484 / JCM 11386 / HI 11/12) TaxID=638303 RepID=D3SPA1_THEAH|nr:RdgB/HAM1 family non-canonical purine NTP pyrophosphatase [Thermocrinis albus]ADC88988.1 non-canonical purine NTP pyrophosphatase, rdgB/HAM1 family [Thermocrinis albus DSM 14484]